MLPGVDLDPTLLRVAVKAPNPDGVTLHLMPLKRGTPVLTARLDGPEGPVVAWKGIDDFTLYIPPREHVVTSLVDGGAGGLMSG